MLGGISLATLPSCISPHQDIDIGRDSSSHAESLRQSLPTSTIFCTTELRDTYNQDFDDFSLIYEAKSFLQQDQISDKAKIDRFIDLFNSSSTIQNSLKDGYITLQDIVSSISPSNYSYLFYFLVSSGYQFQDSHTDKAIQLRVLQSLANGNDTDYHLFITCLAGDNISATKKVFQSQYGHAMCEYMIRRLVDKDYHEETIKFLQYYLERLKLEWGISDSIAIDDLAENSHFTGFFSLLNNFRLHRNKMPLLHKSLMNTTILQLLKKTLLLHKTLEPSYLEDYLKVLYRYLEWNPRPSRFVIKMANYYFLSFLSRMADVNCAVLVSYLVSLFPNSRELLTSTGLLNMLFNGSVKTEFDPDHEFLHPQIREELVLTNEYPTLETLNLIYAKYLFENTPSKIQTRFLFDGYINSIIEVQRSQKSHLHPFSSNCHNSIVLETFLRYSLYNLKKPRFACNLLIKYLDSVHSCKYHTHALSRLLAELASKDISETCQLVNTLKRKCKLETPVFVAIIDNLIRINELESAREYYDYLCSNSRLVVNLKKGDADRFYQEYGWPIPKSHARKSTEMLPVWLSCEETFDVTKVIEFLETYKP
ncbi:hypothetical protein FOA43_003817 [Brettanomyces nanus]|uniref:Uncharacterized protein n=1 Tax=Eeniella nana TaxID=13502 RepID=A0A875S659_EENNA|nr:uncharacterized protein FOA43_003817 [Brettanomyces nanus]QPG76428.1 hypothetical protein FOA43_003817 [Brettanomyces nanus]